MHRINHQGTPAGRALAPSALACVPDVVSQCRRGQRGCSWTFLATTRRGLLVPHAKPPTFPDNDPVDNPDFDDLELNDEYYRDMGMTKEDIEDQMAFKASDIDPMVRRCRIAPWSIMSTTQGEDLSLDSLFKTRKGLPRHLMDQTEEAEKPGWGPEARLVKQHEIAHNCAQVALLAGFRAEEAVMVRVVLDALGANDVKVVVSTNDMLHTPAIRALQAPEPVWEQPRDLESVGYGGGWGAQRTILFAGLRYVG